VNFYPIREGRRHELHKFSQNCVGSFICMEQKNDMGSHKIGSQRKPVASGVSSNRGVIYKIIRRDALNIDGPMRI
jgi:hypothetical protein